MIRNKDALIELIGQTLSGIRGDKGSDEIIFTLEDGRAFRMYHEQNCCESVKVEDIAGDMKDLVGSPILQAEESSSGENPDDYEVSEHDQGCFTWTFYRFATINGSVTIRWYGESASEFYSEEVDCSITDGPSWKKGKNNENNK